MTARFRARISVREPTFEFEIWLEPLAVAVSDRNAPVWATTIGRLAPPENFLDTGDSAVGTYASDLLREIAPFPASPAARLGGASTKPLPPDQLSLGDRCIYFFKGDQYVRYRVATEILSNGAVAPFEAVDVGPAPISRFWTHLHPFFHRDIDAAVNWGNGKVYFFKRDQYVRYDIATDLIDVGPAPISRFWTHLHPFFHRDIDTALNWGNGKVYFFKQDQYVRYDIASDLIDVGPAPISRFWTHLHPFFHRDIDAAVNWGDGKVYFFKQDQYVRYDIVMDLIDVGPAPISRFWTHLPPLFQRGVKAVVNWTGPMDLAAYLGSTGLVVNEIGDWRNRARPGQFTPVGVMIHHTADNLKQPTIIVSGRPDPKFGFLHGPLANFHVPKSGEINIISAGLANHAGGGSHQVLFELTHDAVVNRDASARRLPNDMGGNRFLYGFENQNLGNGHDPWPPAQVDSMVSAVAALCRAPCWLPERVIGHREFQNGKIDPAGFDMDLFRDRVRDELG